MGLGVVGTKMVQSSPTPALSWALSLVGEEAERPSAGAGELDEHHLVVEVAVFGAEGGDDLPDGIVDRADAGDALNESLEQPQEKFPEDVVRKKTESGDEGEDDHGGSEVPDEGETLKRLREVGLEEWTEGAADDVDDFSECPQGDNQRGKQ